MYFAYGWPRVLAGIRDPHQRDIIYSSLRGEYLVLVSTSAIQIWAGGQDRVQLGSYVKPQSLVESEGENFAAFWNGARNVLAVLTSENILQLYGLHVSKEELFPGLVSQLGAAPRRELHRVDVFPSASIRLDGAVRATGVVGDSRSFLVSLTDGRFMLVSWSGVSKGFVDPLLMARSPHSHSGVSLSRRSTNTGAHSRPATATGAEDAVAAAAAAALFSQPSTASSADEAISRFHSSFSAIQGSPAFPGLISQPSNVSELSAASGLSYCDSAFGEAVANMGISLSGESSSHIWHMDYSEQLHLLAVVLLDGRVAICRTSEHGLAPAEQIKMVRWVCGRGSGSLFACIGARAQTVAVGSSNGQVALYTLTKGKSKASSSSKGSSSAQAAPARVLSIVDWGHKPHLTGGVAYMEWSPDCRALAVGWRKQGMAVWSPSGCRLMCSLRQKSEQTSSFRRDPSVDSLSPKHMPEEAPPYEPLEGGIAALCWGPEGYQLILAERGRPHQLLEISFAKSVDGDHRVPRVDIVDSTRLQDEEVYVLQAADRLLLITESQEAAASSNWSQWNVGGQEANHIPEDLVVRHLRVPPAYMASNWPLIHAAVSADGYDIACAGSRGLALYSRRSGKWRLFGDVSQERSICTMAVIWLPKIVVACAHVEGDRATAPAELLLYPRYHLDNSSLLARFPLPIIPLALDAVGHHLLVACAPLDIMVLKVEVQGELTPRSSATASVTLLRELSIMSVGYQLLDIALVAADAMQNLVRHMLSSRRRSENGSDAGGNFIGANCSEGMFTKALSRSWDREDEEPTHCVVLRAGGLLSVLDMERGSEVLLDNDVECFWLSGAILSQELFHPKQKAQTAFSTSSYQASTSSTSLVNLPSRITSSAVYLGVPPPSPLKNTDAVVNAQTPADSGSLTPGRKTKRNDLQIKVAQNSEELQLKAVPASSRTRSPATCRDDDENAEYAAVEMPWWAYGARGMQLWYPSSIAEPSTPTSVGTAVASFQPTGAPDPELEFDREVYPVGISLADAAIVGVTQRMQKSSAAAAGGGTGQQQQQGGGRGSSGRPLSHANYPLFHPMAESQPVLPCLLRRLLQKGAYDEAVVLARRHARGHYFSRSLEWLLFTSLEAEHDNHRKAMKERAAKPPQPVTRFGRQARQSHDTFAGLKLMRKAVRLIRMFPQYSDVVVSVARKTDAALWPLLFNAVGSPSKLIQGLLETKALQSAACCLLCVDRLEGADKAQEFSLKIIQDALEMEQYNLALELLRFVIPPTDADSVFESIDEEDARVCAATSSAASGTSTPAPTPASAAASHGSIPADQGGATASQLGGGGGWLSWMWGSSSSGPPSPATSQGSDKQEPAQEKPNYRTSCVAAMSRPLTVMAPPPKALPEAQPVDGGFLSSASSGDSKAGLAAWGIIAEHAQHLLQFGKLRSLASLGRAMASLGDGMPRLLVAARRRSGMAAGGSSESRHGLDVDLLSALAVVHSDLSGVITDPDALSDAILLHDSCLAAGYMSWAAALAMVLEHHPTLLELKQDLPETWANFSRAVRNEPQFAAYWRVLEVVETEIRPAPRA